VSKPLTAEEALRRSTFTEYRKTALTPISDITYPPGTVFQTPEGLRAEDEDTRAAFDVQGGIYPIRESVFRASYAATPTPDTHDVEALADMAVMSLGSVLTGNDYARYHALFRAKFVDRLNRAAEYRVLAALDATREEMP